MDVLVRRILPFSTDLEVHRTPISRVAAALVCAQSCGFASGRFDDLPKFDDLLISAELT